MKIKVGDKVKFLNDTGGGVVSGIIDSRMVNVRIEEGFEVPSLISELVVDTDDSQLIEKQDVTFRAREKSPEPDTEAVEAGEDDIDSQDLPAGALRKIYLGLVPAGDSVSDNSNINTYLINDCDFYIFYMAGYQEKDSFYYLKSGMLEANTKEFIRTFSQTEISKIRKFHFQVLFISKGMYFPQHPVDEHVSVSSTGLYKESSYKENDFFDEKAVILTVVSDNSADETEKNAGSELFQQIIDKNKKEDSRIKKQEKKGRTDIEEVDLHIHEITDDYSNLSDGEKLNIQLNRFYSVIDGAIGDKNRKIVFIHGVGNGKLKYEIRNALDTKYPDLDYQDASFRDYGFGATLVTIRGNNLL